MIKTLEEERKYKRKKDEEDIELEAVDVEEGEKSIAKDKNMALKVGLPNQTSPASDINGRSDGGRLPDPEVENRIEIGDRDRDRIKKKTPIVQFDQTRETMELQ